MLNYDEIGWTPEFPTIGRAEGVLQLYHLPYAAIVTPMAAF